MFCDLDSLGIIFAENLWTYLIFNERTLNFFDVYDDNSNILRNSNLQIIRL